MGLLFLICVLKKRELILGSVYYQQTKKLKLKNLDLVEPLSFLHPYVGTTDKNYLEIRKQI